jgi:cell division protein FtsA
VLDGLKRQDRKKIELQQEEEVLNNTEAPVEQETKELPIKERRSFLDKLTERVKDFLDNAE